MIVVLHVVVKNKFDETIMNFGQTLSKLMVVVLNVVYCIFNY